MARRRRAWGWLAGAVALLLGAVWLMWSAEAPIPPEPRRVVLPFSMSPDELRRSDARRTVVRAPATDAGLLMPPPRSRDPLMAIMPPTVQRGAIVAEFNAIVNSDIGQVMLECLFGGGSPLLEQLRDAGVDPSTGLDRVAFIDDSLVMTGDFRGEGWKALIPSAPTIEDYGAHGRLYTWQLGDAGTRAMASWGGQMLIASPDVATARQTLDRLDPGAPSTQGVMTEDQAYGEVYGVLSPAVLAELVSGEDPQLGATIREVAGPVRLHADVAHDMGLVADIDGADPTRTEELRRALGGALSVARMSAQAKGRTDEAQLLDGARVRAAGGGSFRMQAGLPYEYLEKVFRECVERKRGARSVSNRAEAPEGRGHPAP